MNPRPHFHRVVVLLVFWLVQTLATAQLCTTVGTNIFPDGDLGTGAANVLPFDPGIAPGYVYTTIPPPVDGAYCVANNTSTWDWFAELFWVNEADNSPDPNGYMMVVNASYEPGIFYEKTVVVCGNTPYVFSADVLNLFQPGVPDAILPDVDFLVDGDVVFSTGDIPQDGAWHTYEFILHTPPDATQFTFALRNNAPGGFGNDLALDNISLRFCDPAVTLPSNNVLCGGTFEFQPIIGGGGWQNPFFQWQTSLDNGLTWTELPGATNYAFTPSGQMPGQLFRVLVAGSTANLTDEGCRSVSNSAQVEIIENEVFLAETICEGEAVILGGQWFTSTGEYEVTLASTTGGCDTIAHLNLEVLPASWIMVEAAICEGEFFTFGSDDLTVPGTYSQTLTNSLGCDSTLTLELAVSSIIHEEISGVICEGKTFFFAGQNIGTAGQYEQTLPSASGCDSTVMLTLEVFPEALTELEVEICEGEIFAGKYFIESTMIWDTLNTWRGCDSIVMTQLIVHQSPHDTLEISLCFGDEFDGIPHFQNTTIVHQGQTVNGCDSLTTYLLSVAEEMTPAIDGPAAICEGGEATLSTGIFAQYFWQNGDAVSSLSTLLATEPGGYAVTVTDAAGCTATASHELAVSSVEAIFEVIPPACFGDENGSVEVLETSGGFAPYFLEMNGENRVGAGWFGNLAAGLYPLTVSDSLGCIFTAEVNVPQPAEFVLSLGEDVEIELGDSLQVQALSALPVAIYEWLPAENLDCSDCVSPWIFPLETTTLHLYATTEKGCEAEGNIRLVVRKNRDIYVPNAFSPNGDGINDFFTIYPGKGLREISRFEVFNRWGERVFSRKNWRPDELAINGGWDGTFRNWRAAPGVYVWFMEVEYVDGFRELLKGEVALMR